MIEKLKMYILKIIIHIIQVYKNNIIKVVLFKAIDAFLVTTLCRTFNRISGI